ncbi:hypothetical protein F4781DRAFT_406284 [Annulohypoxylon bovei var. microspora]|nr:hypothetical protein F4781DRAFT_406284 [Annulohypoxylon bovei var. microspora]
MRFSTHGSAAVAMAASLASATAPVSDRDLLNLDLPKDLSQPISANVDLGIDLSGTTLAAGVLANVAVPPVLGAAADVEVAIVCDTCYTKGNINASINLDNVVPALSLTLTDIEAKLDLDVKIGAAAVIAVNLFTPPAPISLPLPGLKVDALISLDLVIGVETAIDLSAGIDVKLVDEAHIETDILAGKILDAAFSGLSVQVLPVEVRIGCTKLMADLRLRVELGVAAEVGVDDIVPILDLPEIGAGLEVAVFANLLEYVGFFCATPSCPLSKESYGLNIGAAVELDVSVEDLLSIHLAPTLSTALLSYPTTTLCEHPSYTASVPTLSASVPASISIPGGSLPSASASLPVGSGGSGSGYPSQSVPAGGAGGSTSATAAVTTPAPNGGASTTSTVTNTQTFTVTQCAATVPNCPAGYATTATLVHTTVYTTVCPATQTAPITAPPKATHTKPATPVTVTKESVTLVPCSGVSTFTPPSNVPTAPYPTGGKPAVSTTPAASSSATLPVGTPSVTTPAGKPTGSYPVGAPSNSVPARGSSTSPEAPPAAGYPTGSAPAGGVPTASVPVAGYPSASVPAAGPSGSVPAGGYPSAPVPSASASESMPVGSATASVPAGSATASVPVGGSPSYPAAGPTGGYPVSGTTEVPPYPTTSCTTPVTLSTRQPSASASYPSTPSYPAGETPIATAGAAKLGSGAAGLIALVGAVVALM